MKKFFSLITLVLLFSCAKEADVPVQPEQPVQEALTYTLSVPAGKDTKALNIDGTALKATWAEGETARVFRGELLLGTLTAQTAGQSTTLTGEIKGEIKDDDKFTLRFLSPSYTSQDGTLDYIAAHCDYAVANVTVSSISGSNVTTSTASFENQQAIVKFTLNVSAKPLMVVLPDQTITVTPASAASELYVAIPAVADQSLSLKAIVGNTLYVLDKEHATLDAGKYYNITANLSATSTIVVHNQAELENAVQTDGAQILFANDISIDALLQITGNRTITIDMNGFTLDRGCTSRDTQAIVVRTGSKLNLSNGTVTGGWGGNGGALDIEDGTTVNLTDVIISGNKANDRGGGICIRKGGTLNMTGGAITGNSSKDNSGIPAGGGGLFIYEGSTATLTGVTISGNETKVYGGGGIDNFGTLTLNGCTITGNTSKANGAGIWTSAGSTLNMLGEMTVADNTADESVASNLFLSEGAVITVTGSLAGSSIGINMKSETGTFTSGYSTYNSGEDPSTLFFSDLPMTVNVTSTGTEAQMAYAMDVSYIKCSWDEVNKQVISKTKTLHEGDYTVLTSGGNISLTSGYYVVRGTVSRGTIDLTGGHTVHLILCDGAKLTANYIHLEYDEYHTGTGDRDSLYIYSQSYGGKMGKLRVDNSDTITDAGIGTGYARMKTSPSMGALIVHGGDIYSKGGTNAAGIGGGHGGRGGRVYVYGGRVEAHGGEGAGTNSGGGAGIGSGYFAPAGAVWVYGGEVYAYGGQDAAGIGSGDGGNIMQHDFDKWIHAGWFTMYGGYVEAHGGGNGAGIGGGEYSPGPKDVSIYGGTVKAYGGEDAAGIGGGYYTMDYGISTGVVNIYGGEVYAYGADEGAGIGGGENGDGAEVTITGGIVEAHAGENELNYKAIGPGRDSNNYGSLNLGDQMMVRYKIGNNWSVPVPVAYEYGRKAGAWYHTETRIEPCTHPGYNASNCPYHVHP